MLLYLTILELIIVSYAKQEQIVKKSVQAISIELAKVSVVSVITVVRTALDLMLINVLAA
jgi:hypothetical protein